MRNKGVRLVCYAYFKEAFKNFRQLMDGEDAKYSIKVFDEPKMVKNFSGIAGELSSLGPFEVVDLTGGLKLVPVLAYEVAKRKNSKTAYVFSPGLGARGWWDVPGKNSFVPKVFSQLHAPNAAFPKPKPLPLPRVLSSLKPRDDIKKLTLQMTRVFNSVSDERASLATSEKAVVGLQLDAGYSLVRLVHKRDAFARVLKAHLECSQLPSRFRKTANSLAEYAGFSEIVVERANDFVPLELKRGTKLSADVLRSNHQLLFLMDTNLAYRGVHSEIFEALIELNVSGSRRVSLEDVKKYFAFSYVNKREVSNKLTSLKSDSVIWDYLSLVFKFIDELENPNIKIDVGDEFETAKRTTSTDTSALPTKSTTGRDRQPR